MQETQDFDIFWIRIIKLKTVTKQQKYIYIMELILKKTIILQIYKNI